MGRSCNNVKKECNTRVHMCHVLSRFCILVPIYLVTQEKADKEWFFFFKV